MCNTFANRLCRQTYFAIPFASSLSTNLLYSSFWQLFSLMAARLLVTEISHFNQCVKYSVNLLLITHQHIFFTSTTWESPQNVLYDRVYTILGPAFGTVVFLHMCHHTVISTSDGSGYCFQAHLSLSKNIYRFYTLGSEVGVTAFRAILWAYQVKRQGLDFTQIQFETSNFTFHLYQNILFDLDIFHTTYNL